MEELKSIMDSYNEYHVNYYMNEQAYIDNDDDRVIAEILATKESIEMYRH